MKAYTDLEQSRKLAEILPIESADMCYIQDLLAGLKYGEYQPYIGSDLIPAYGQGKIRCWSLAALLEILRNNGRYELQLWDGGYTFEANGFMPCCRQCVYCHQPSLPRQDSCHCRDSAPSPVHQV